MRARILLMVCLVLMAGLSVVGWFIYREPDSKSGGVHPPCGFDSLLRHHTFNDLRVPRAMELSLF